MQTTHKKLAIIGAGGHGKVVAATALATARWTEIVFLDDEAEGEILGLPVIGCTGLAGMSVLPAEYDLAVAVVLPRWAFPCPLSFIRVPSLRPMSKSAQAA